MAQFSLLLSQLALVAVCTGVSSPAIAQTAGAQRAGPQTINTGADANTSSKSNTTKVIKPGKVTKPLWIELNATQHKALAPLQTEWLKMSEGQKRKWLELSKNYDKLKAEDQTKLHARMADWVKLSPDERTAARLNFSVAKTLSTEEKQKQWQAYQALSSDEKAKLQAKAKASTPNSAALAAKPQNKVILGKPSAPTSSPTVTSNTLVPAEK